MRRTVHRSSDGLLPWPASDPSVERQARYVSAVVRYARRTDAKKMRTIQLERAYLAELNSRTAPPTPR